MKKLRNNFQLKEQKSPEEANDEIADDMESDQKQNMAEEQKEIKNSDFAFVAVSDIEY